MIRIGTTNQKCGWAKWELKECGSQSQVWLIDKEDKGRPHDESSEVMSYGQVVEHVPDHVTEHVADHMTSQTA